MVEIDHAYCSSSRVVMICHPSHVKVVMRGMLATYRVQSFARLKKRRLGTLNADPLVLKCGVIGSGLAYHDAAKCGACTVSPSATWTRKMSCGIFGRSAPRRVCLCTARLSLLGYHESLQRSGKHVIRPVPCLETTINLAHTRTLALTNAFTHQIDKTN